MKMEKKSSNITIKIIALIFAIFLWAYVMGEVNPITNKVFSNIDVKFQYAEELEKSNIVLMEPKELKIEVKLAGRRNELLQITDKDITAKIDLRGYYEGTYKIPIEVTSTAGKDFVEDYSPKEILVRFDSRIEKQFPITTAISGKPEEGYAVLESELKPDSVIIKGPKSIVNKVEKVVARVDVEGSVKDISMTVPLSIVDEKGQEVVGLVKDPQIASVKIPLAKTKQVPIKAQLKGEVLKGYTVSNVIVEPNTILIKGEGADLSKLTEVLTEPIDINLLAKDKELVVEVITDGTYSLVDKKKVKIKIEMEEIIEKNFDFTIDQAKLIGLSESLELNTEKTDAHFNIVLSGPKSKMDKIDKDDLVPVIDLENAVEGINKLKIHSTIPDGVERIEEAEYVNIYLNKIQN